MSTQLIGFSIGGLARRFLVTPPSMSKSSSLFIRETSFTGDGSVWPNTLVSCALFNTLHSQSYVGIGQHEGLSRERFFLYAFISAALWCQYPYFAGSSRY